MEAKVNIDGTIVSAAGSGTKYPYSNLQYVRDMLEWQKPFDAVRVIINSPGGSVAEGFAIYDYLRALNVEVKTEAVGQCSSMATVIFLERVMHW